MQTWINATEAAAMLGIPRGSMKAYERHDTVRTCRTPGGHRRYLLADVERIAAERRVISPTVAVIPAGAAH